MTWTSKTSGMASVPEGSLRTRGEQAKEAPDHVAALESSLGYGRYVGKLSHVVGRCVHDPDELASLVRVASTGES
jgi:hypothetical protein